MPRPPALAHRPRTGRLLAGRPRAWHTHRARALDGAAVHCENIKPPETSVSVQTYVSHPETRVPWVCRGEKVGTSPGH